MLLRSLACIPRGESGTSEEIAHNVSPARLDIAYERFGDGAGAPGSAGPYSQEAEPDQQQAEHPEDGRLQRLERPEPVRRLVGHDLPVAGGREPIEAPLLRGLAGGVLRRHALRNPGRQRVDGTPRPILTASQWRREPLCCQTRSCAPVSNSRLISGAPQNMPTTAGTAITSALSPR